MNYPRPVPLIGDQSSAESRASRVDAWRFTDEQLEVFYDVLYSRRDVRRFRPDGFSEEILHRILAAAHSAPSVGHSQPWRFIIVKSAETRAKAAQLAAKERLLQADKLFGDKKRKMLDLQLEGIAEAPVGIVLCCDRRVDNEQVLGRATYFDADIWSCACAVENLWLAARAEGLGLGWVTLFQSKDLASLLAIPDGVVNLGWLCLGWPDERNTSPGLERHGWSKKIDLEDTVLHETWLNKDLHCGQDTVSAPTGSQITMVRDKVDALLYVPGSLGLLDKTLDRLSYYGVSSSENPVLVLVGCDHNIATHQVSAYSSSVTKEVFEAALNGESLGAAMAMVSGVQVIPVDVGINGAESLRCMRVIPNRHKGDILNEDALDLEDAENIFDKGKALAKEIIMKSKIVLIGDVGIGNTTVAASLASILLDMDGEKCVGLGASADYSMTKNKALLVDKIKLRVASEIKGKDIADEAPLVLVAKAGGADIAFMCGVIFGFAKESGIVILDGYLTSVAGLLASRIDPLVASHLLASHLSKEPTHKLILDELGLEPLYDFRLRAGEGIGATLAWQILRTGLAARSATAKVVEHNLVEKS